MADFRKKMSFKNLDQETLKQFEDSKDPELQFTLAMCYSIGLGTNIDLVKAFEWFKKAAEQDHAQAQLQI